MIDEQQHCIPLCLDTFRTMWVMVRMQTQQGMKLVGPFNNLSEAKAWMLKKKEKFVFPEYPFVSVYNPEWVDDWSV